MKKAEPTQEMKLMRISAKLKEIALDIREPGRTQGQMDHDSNRIQKAAVEIEQFVTGHGTGNS